MHRIVLLPLLSGLLLLDASAAIQIGTARIDISPTEPIRLNGYGNRREPTGEIAQRLWAKALVIGKDNPSVLITADLIGVPQWLTDRVAAALKKSHGVAPGSVAICATHTHTGPTVKTILEDIFMAPIPPEHMAAIDRYALQLENKLISLATTALDNRRPGALAWGVGKAEFAINRRSLKDGKWIGFGEVPSGPVDHSLPLMRVTDAEGKIVALLVNYACHCTTLGGNFNKIHGDWAGEAAARIEAKHPDINAMIAIGCGADANPKDRGTFDMIPIHGQTVADEVERLLRTELTSITAPPTATQKSIDLPFDPLPSKAEWQQLADRKDRWSHYGKKMLQKIATGRKLRQSIPYSIQTWQFGNQLAMIFLPGEVVVDYSIRLKEIFDSERLWINAYANDLPSYIASRRLYDEGGYEVDRSMWYYGKPVRLTKDTEELVLDEITRQLPHSFYSKKTLRQMPAPTPKDRALNTIRVRNGMQVELAAAEPMVMDPVDIAWSADGKMWVVEMADYPNGLDDEGQPGGRVRFLEDTNADGRYDQSTLFLDGLNFPSSVMPWRDGVLITAAPDLLFAQDTNNDGSADKVDKLFTGFVEGNQQHRVNSLQWGLDGWVYSANGDSNGRIKSHKTGKIVDISNMDFRFRPDKGEFERLPGRTQYGRNRDDVGNWFGSNNSWPGWHFPLPDHYLRRNPHVSYPSLKSYLQSPPSAGPVYPASRTLNRLNDYSKANRFTSACGLAIYRDSLLGREFHGNSFVCEPVHNLVRRELLSSHGGTFTSRQPANEKGREFFASSDNWSRPTSVRTGPDGALYVVDMYRFLIEHPQWVPADWQRKLNLREGHDKGRIYRVFPKDKQPRPIQDLTKLKTEQLVAALDSPNGIQRDLSHMLLLWRQDKTAINHLHTLFWNSPRALARMQALCTLDNFNALTPSVLEDALLDPSPAVRTWAIRLAEPHLNTAASLLSRLRRLADDPDISVRKQLALSIGNAKSPTAGKILGRLASKARDSYSVAAILSSANGRTDAILSALEAKELSSELLSGLFQTALANGNDPAVQRLIVSNRHSRATLLLDLLRHRSGALGKYVALFDRQLAAAAETLANQQANDTARINALELLSRAPVSVAAADSNMWPLLESPATSVKLRAATLDALTRVSPSTFATRILSLWNHLPPSIRKSALDKLLRRTDWTRILLSHIQQNPSMARTVSPPQQITLKTHRTTAIRNLAIKAFGGKANADRDKVIESFAPALALTGNPKRGQTLFGAACSVCHRIGNNGNVVGPNLTALTDRSPRAMLTAILDPNRAVEDKFLSFTATKKDGTERTGLIVEESGSTIRLADASGQSHILQRTELASLAGSGLSLMPEGFESAFSHQAMADLLAYVSSLGSTPKVAADDKGEYHLVPRLGHSSRGAAPFDAAQNAFIGFTSADTVSWIIESIPAGTYDIMASAALDRGYSGKPFHLTVAGTQADGIIETTGGLTRYRARKFGNIRISKTTRNAKVDLRHSIDGASLSVKEVVLIPVR